MKLVWVEYFADGLNARFFALPIAAVAELVVPCGKPLRSLQACVAATGRKRRSENTHGRQLHPCQPHALDATLWTQDADFEGVEGVKYVANKRNHRKDQPGFPWLALPFSLKQELTFVLDHTGIGVADVARSAAFYDAALGALGMRRVMQLPEHSGADAVGYGVGYPIFWIDRFHPHSTRNHTAFAAGSRAAVDAFHAAALKTGGTDNGPPGLRKGYPPGYYAAFVLDPDGNNIEAVYRER